MFTFTNDSTCFIYSFSSFNFNLDYFFVRVDNTLYSVKGVSTVLDQIFN